MMHWHLVGLDGDLWCVVVLSHLKPWHTRWNCVVLFYKNTQYSESNCAISLKFGMYSA